MTHTIFHFCKTAEICPEGEETVSIPQDVEQFDLYLPTNENNPEDALPGKSGLPVEKNDIILITPIFTPDVFRLMDVKFTLENVKKLLVVVVFKSTASSRIIPVSMICNTTEEHSILTSLP